MPRVVELRTENDWLGRMLDPLLAARASIAKQLKIVSANVLNTAREDADVRRMMTVPGIGAMTALAFKAAIDDPKRFSSSTKVGPYLGLTPRQYQSGESEWIGGIGKANDPLLRSYLYEAAGVLMTRVRRSCPLKAWALRLAKRVGWKRASIAVASLPSFCTPSGRTAPSSSGKRRRRLSLDMPRPSFRVSGGRPGRDDGQIDLVWIVAGPAPRG
jgi:transposase